MTSRIEEIKERWSRTATGEFEWFTPTILEEKHNLAVEHSWSDIEYLLAKIEIAEKALGRFADESNWDKDEYGEPVWIRVNEEHPSLVGVEALKAIRE